MIYSADCIACTIKKHYKVIENEPDEAKKNEYLNLIVKNMATAPDDHIPTEYADYYEHEYERIFGKKRDYSQMKKQFNDELLKREDTYRRLIRTEADPLAAALKLARTGNYIDAGTIANPNKEALDLLLKDSLKMNLDSTEYDNFTREMKQAKKFVLVCDNAGEIVMDKLLLEVIREIYPSLDITVLVRGGDVINDATEKDAEYVGMTEEFKVIGNGNTGAGTIIRRLSPEARELLESADVILAKGQANTETLMDSGWNVYFLFLCKCIRFVKNYGLPMMEGAFINAKRFTKR